MAEIKSQGRAPGEPPAQTNEAREGGATPELKEIWDKIEANLELIIRIREAKSIEEAAKLSEELEKRLGIRVLWDINNLDQYPALVINMHKDSDIIAWLDISRKKFIGITQSTFKRTRCKEGFFDIGAYYCED